MSARAFEFGLDTPAQVSVDESGQLLDGDQVIRNTVEEAVLAESVGLDSFNIGEHYRSEFMDSAGHVILAAIASRTARIRLGTAVTVLSTQDPVRVYTEFATLDAVSNGRAQLIVGRGSLTDSFPLFGFDLADYETLFEEKLDLLTRLLRDQPVTWSGTTRSPLANQYLSPPLPAGRLPTWVGDGSWAVESSWESEGATERKSCRLKTKRSGITRPKPLRPMAASSHQRHMVRRGQRRRRSPFFWRRRRQCGKPRTALWRKGWKGCGKRGGNGTQTVRSFQAPKPPQQAGSLCHRLAPVASRVAW
jgi:Luciferase-like monooxygenase